MGKLSYPLLKNFNRHVSGNFPSSENISEKSESTTRPRWEERERGKCSGGDLNPHALRHAPLKRTCLPFHHPSFVFWKGVNTYHGAGIRQGFFFTQFSPFFGCLTRARACGLRSPSRPDEERVWAIF